jgi:muconolactone delta-isomerase
MGSSFYGCSYRPQSEGKIIGGGVPAGERALVLIFDAESNEGLDTILQRLPLGFGKVESNSAREPRR